MNKTALAILLIFALLFSVVVVFFVGLAGANPYLSRMGFKDIDPFPGTIPPKITSLNLRNHTTYLSRDLNVTISATRPVTSYPARFGPLYVYYFLDGLHQDYMFYTFPSSEVDSSTVLSSLRSGSHELVVQVVCYVEPGGMSAVFSVDSNSTVFFTIGSAGYSLTPSPSPILTPSPSPLSTATPELIPTPTPTPEPESLPTSLVMASSVTAAVVLIGIVLLLYGIKRK